MKKNIVWLFLCFSSCVINKEMQTVKYAPLKGGVQIFASIPQGYEFHTIVGGLGESYLYLYKYDDSSMIYITDDNNGGPNYNNIRSQEGSYSKLFESMQNKDTLTLAGINERNLYWKHRSLGKYSIGYKGVPISEKQKFDKAILSVRRSR